MGSFCEAFGITGIRAPSRDRRNREFSSFRKSYRKRKHRRPIPSQLIPSSQKLKDITCFRCGKKGHTANRCRSKGKTKINEIIDDISDTDSQAKERIKTKLQQYSYESEDSSLDFSPIDDIQSCKCKQINMIKIPKMKSNSKELLFEMIQQIPDLEQQREYLKRLKDLLVREDEEQRYPFQSFSISKLLETYPINNIAAQPDQINHSKSEIKQLKSEIKQIKENLYNLETKNLEIETQICILQSHINRGKQIEISAPDIDKSHEDFTFNINVPQSNPPDTTFISSINSFSFQKWFIYITLKIQNHSETFLAMVDSGADHSVIRDGLIPTQYYELTNE